MVPPKAAGSVQLKTRGIIAGDRVFIGSVLLLTVAIHLVHLLFFRRNPSFDHPIIDAQEYLKTAIQTLNTIRAGFVPGEPYYHSPLYPWVLAAVLAAFGRNLLVCRLLQILLTTIAGFLLYVLGRRVFPNDRTIARMAMAGWALYGPVVFYTGELVNVSLLLVLAVAGLCLLCAAWPSQKLSPWWWSGLTWGLGGITRPDILPFLGLMTVLVVVRSVRAKAPRRGMAMAGVFVLGILLPFLAVGWKNYANSKRFLMLPINSGLNFYIGNNPDYKSTIAVRPGAAWERLTSKPAADDYTPRPGDSANNAYYYGKVAEFAATQPWQFIQCQVYKLRTLVNGRELPETFDLYSYRSYSPVLAALVWKAGWFGFPWCVLLPLALVGIWTARRRLVSGDAADRVVWIPLAYLGCMTASLIVYWNSARYRMSLVPALLLFAGYGLAGVRDMARRGARLAGGGALAAAAMMLAFSIPYDHFSARVNYRAELLAFVAMERLEEGAVAEGLRLLEQSLSLSDNSDVRANYAWALEQQGRTNDALREYERSLRQNAAAKVRVNYGVLLGKLDRIPEAIAQYQAAISSNPRHTDAYYSLGNAHFKLGNYEAAARQYLTALRLNPSHGEADYNLALAYEQLGNTAAAEKHYRRVMGRKPTAEACNRLGIISAHKGKLDEAMALFSQAVQLNPADKGIQSNLQIVIGLRQPRSSDPSSKQHSKQH